MILTILNVTEDGRDCQGQVILSLNPTPYGMNPYVTQEESLHSPLKIGHFVTQEQSLHMFHLLLDMPYFLTFIVEH